MRPYHEHPGEGQVFPPSPSAAFEESTAAARVSVTLPLAPRRQP